MNDGGPARDMTLRQHIEIEAMKVLLADSLRMIAAGTLKLPDEQAWPKVRGKIRTEARAMAHEMLKEDEP